MKMNQIKFEVSHNKAFNIAQNPKLDGYQCGLASVVYKVFIEKNLYQ